MNNIELFDSLVADMDIPESRKHDWGWLRRNLGIRNSSHENFDEAVSLLKIIIREQNK